MSYEDILRLAAEKFYTSEYPVVCKHVKRRFSQFNFHRAIAPWKTERDSNFETNGTCSKDSGITVESRLYVQVGTQKFGRRTERDVQVKIIFRAMQSILDETIPSVRTNDWDLQLRDV